MRVLVSAESFLPATNGVTNSVLRLARYLTAAGHQVLVVAPGPGDAEVALEGGFRLAVARVRGVEVPRYPSLRVGVPSARLLHRLIDDFAPDVVHLAAPVVLGARIGLVVSGLGLPAVAVFQTDLVGFARAYGLGPASAAPIWSWLRSIHNRADLTLAPTRPVAAELRRHGFARVDVWGRGVDRRQFDPARRSPSLRHDWGAGRHRRAVGYVGRLAPEKHVERLRVLHGRPDLQLVVIGDGPDRERLGQVLPEARFTGLLLGDELGAAVASLDLVVHTGEHETFCQVVQEAMASGVAVVAPAAGGPLDLIEHGRTGLLYRPGDDRALARAVDLLLTDPDLRHRCAAAGRMAVASRTWESVNAQLLAHYRSVASRRVAA